MKYNPLRLQSQQGSALAMTLVITGILGFLLVTYLTLVRSQNISNMRSQSWNQAIPVIEAGVEDALTHLNTHGMSNLTCDSWNQLGSIWYLKRSVGNNYYVVTISNWVAGSTNNPPVVESRGFVGMPAIMAAAGGPMYAAAFTPNDTGYLGRGVRVRTRQDWLFVKGMVAKGAIDLRGNNIISDSYDSANPLYNTGGLYDWNKHRDHGDIATNSGLTNSLSVGNANVWGRVATGPKGAVDIGVGSVGDAAWQLSGRRGIKPGYCTDDMNVDFPDVWPPFNGGYMTPAAGTNNGIYYDFLLDSGNYQLDTLTMGGYQTLYVKSNAVLYVRGDINLSGNASIIVAPGASFQLYGAGANTLLNGNGVINQTGNATNFVYYGLPSNTSLALGGNSTFIGVIYAPNAEFTLGGGGSTIIDFCGASVTGSVKMNGHFRFHYDEALSYRGPFRRYIVTRWDEMTPEQFGQTQVDTSPQGVIQ